MNRSRTAIQNREGILAELESEEEILAACEASVLAEDGYGSSRYVGAVVVTGERLFCVESKPFGRLRVVSLPWSSVREPATRSGSARLALAGVDSTGRWRKWLVDCPAGDEEIELLDAAIARARG